MAENSKIQWTTHTFNPWRGCTKVAEGCKFCYADAQSKRNPKTLGIWGPNGTRVLAAEAMWHEPVKWNREAVACPNCNRSHDRGFVDGVSLRRCLNCGITFTPDRPRVFCASLADVFEKWDGPLSDSNGMPLYTINGAEFFTEGEYPECRPTTMDDSRARLFALIDSTPNLDWLILSKRPENIRRMIENIGPPLYNPVHEHTQRTRANRLSGGDVRRTGNRQRGANLEGCEADGRSVARWDKNASMPQSEGGESISGVSSAPRHGGRETLLRDGPSASVVSSPRLDPDRTVDQPQERQQARQSTGELGASDVERESTARTGSSKRRPEQAKGVEAPEDASNGGGRSSDPPTSRSRGAGQVNCRVVQHEAEGSKRDLQSSDLASHLSPFYRTNLWLGTSVATQADAERNIPLLLECRELCPVLFLSAEPLIEPIDLRIAWRCRYCGGHDGGGADLHCSGCGRSGEMPNWVIVGGESGSHARPCSVDWIRSIVRQCSAAGVPCFVKQLGAHVVDPRSVGDRHSGIPDSECWPSGRDTKVDHNGRVFLSDRKGGDMAEWPEDLQIREFPSVVRVDQPKRPVHVSGPVD